MNALQLTYGSEKINWQIKATNEYAVLIQNADTFDENISLNFSWQHDEYGGVIFGMGECKLWGFTDNGEKIWQNMDNELFSMTNLIDGRIMITVYP